MGRVSTAGNQVLTEGQLPVLYLSPTRNPALDLGGREARLIVELLKSQGLRDRGDKSLKELRGLLGGLIGSVVNKWPVADAEKRVGIHLAELTDGVAGRVPYLGSTLIDDVFLARVFEFLVSTAGAQRGDARRLETEGLGYSNLLELAVILAAIPDLTHAATPIMPLVPDVVADDVSEESLSDEERQAFMRDAEENAALDDETFFAGNFHAVVLLEEPEAHLHPQLQHGLVSYLKEVVRDRPEVQVIITTHSDQIVAASDPEDLVVCVQTNDGPASRTIKHFQLAPSHLALARRQLDVSRSASIFTDRVVLVEGPTDAVVFRAFARVWAGADRMKSRFVDSLTITVIGSRVGPWLYRLLADPAQPISSRLAILGDSDGKPPPRWVPIATAKSLGRLQVFYSDPTLEPSLLAGNVEMFKALLGHKAERSRPWKNGAEPDVAGVAAFFGSSGRSRKAGFADDVAAYCENNADTVTVPAHMQALIEFVWEGFAMPAAPLIPT